jgi:hypothetical protein
VGRSGSTSGPEIIGLPEFRRALRALGREWPRELRKVNKTIADEAVALARSDAAERGGVWAKAAKAIRARATQNEARIAVRPGPKYPFALAAFWGMKRRTGWYGAKRFRGSGGHQHAPWVGASWRVAERGEGPYVINDALARYRPRLLDRYAEMLDRLHAEAFPD